MHATTVLLLLTFGASCANACTQLGCDARRSYVSPHALAIGSAVSVVWQLNGTLNTPLSIDAKGFLYSATRGDLPRAYRIDPTSGVLRWSEPLPPSVTLTAQVAQPAVSDRGDLVFYQTDVAYLFALRTIDGRQMWNQSLAQNTRQLFAPLTFGRVVVAADSGSLAAFDASNGTELWSVDLCTVVNGTAPPCYAARASPSLCGDASAPNSVVLVTVTDALDLNAAVLAVFAHNGSLAWHRLLEPIDVGTYVVPSAAAYCDIVRELALVTAYSLTSLFALDTAQSGAFAWRQSAVPVRIGVTAGDGADAYYACGFSYCRASLATGNTTLTSAPLTCQSDEGPFYCSPQSEAVRAGAVLLISGGVAGQVRSSLFGYTMNGQPLWRFDCRPRGLQELRSAVVGVDGTIFVNDGVGTVVALRVVNGTLPTISPTPTPETVTPHEITTTQPPTAAHSAPFDGAWVLVFVVGVALAAFGIATLIAMFVLRKRLQYEKLK